jgi:uncharacterized protein
MRYLIIITILFICFFGKLFAQSFSGTIDYGKSSIKFQVKLMEIDNQTKTFFSSIEMNAYEIPCLNTTFKNDTLNYYLVSDYYTYEYLYIQQNENFKGDLKIYSNKTEELLKTFETNLIRNNVNERDSIEKKDFTFISNGLKLYGTMWKPEKSIQKGFFFVTSSQGNDRSGTNAEAYYFANSGYTVFNYDKRGTGKSEGDWQQATIEELCSDDINALEFFSKISSLPLAEIGVKGSSQGGIKIPYILTEIPELKFGISISCPSGTLLESDLNNWKNLNIDKIGQVNINVATKVQKAGYDYLANKLSYKKLNSIKNKYIHEDWFKYIWIPEENVQKDYKLNFIGLPYFKKISQPILVIQGLSDEVIPENSYRIIEKAIKKSKSKKYEILTLENTTHSMTYLDKEFPYFQILSPKYLVSLTDWLNKIENK